MSNKDKVSQEKLVSSECSLESEINTARINALELKLETLSIISESLWNIVRKNSEVPQGDLQNAMADVISARAQRDKITVSCLKCSSLEVVSKGVCSQCGGGLVYNGSISPFDY